MELAGEQADDEVGFVVARACEHVGQGAAPGARDPGPVVAPMAVSTSSRSATVRDPPIVGCMSADERASTSVDQPTPMRPWRGSPVRKPTTVATSVGEQRVNKPASASIFALRERVAAD